MKLRHSLVLFLATSFILGSCQIRELELDVPSDIPEEAISQESEVIITASLEDAPDTKTTFNIENNKMKVYWTPGDRILIFSAGESAEFTAINTVPSRVAKFRGTISFIMGYDEDGGKSYSWALYPHRTDAVYSEPANAENPTYSANITTVMPSLQYGRAETFDDGYGVSVGRSESLNFSFKNAYSGYRVKFTRDDVTSVELKSLDGESLAGVYTICLDEDGLPSVVRVDDGDDSIIFYAPNGGTFESGVNYYITTLPDIQIVNGLSFTLHRNDGYQGTYILRSSSPFNRNYFRYFGTNNGQSEYLNGRLESQTNINNGVSTGWIAPGTNQIWYTTWDHQACTFNGTCESNVYDADLDQGVITFSGPLTTLEDSAFELSLYSESANLKTVTLPSTLQVIGNRAFYACQQLQAVYMGDNVTTIGPYAFYACSNLRSIHLSESLQVLGGYAFSNCLMLTGINIPASVTYMPANWSAWPDLSTVMVGGGNPFFYTASLESFSGAGATADGAFLLADNGERLVSCALNHPSNKESLIIPQGVKIIGHSSLAFGAYKSISLPDGLETIQKAAMYACSLLTELTIPASVTSIGSQAFYSNPDFTKIELKSKVPPTLVNSNAFNSTNNCPIVVPLGYGEVYRNAPVWSELASRIVESEYPEDNQIVYKTSNHQVCTYNGTCVSNTYDTTLDQGVITFSEPLTALPDDAFHFIYNGMGPNNDKIVSVSLPACLEDIGKQAFENCSSLVSVTMGDNVTTIRESAFNACGFTTIRLSNNLIYFGSQAFANCHNLTSITIPLSVTCFPATWSGDGSVTNNGMNPFFNCENLQKIYGKYAGQNNAFAINNGVLYSFAIANPIHAVNCQVPSNVIKLWHNSMTCARFSSIVLPESLTYIGAAALESCDNLLNLTIPADVNYVANLAFADNTSLEWIKFMSYTAPTLANIDAFDDGAGQISVEVQYPWPGDPSYSQDQWYYLPAANRVLYVPDTPAPNQIFYKTANHDIYASEYVKSTNNPLVGNYYDIDWDLGVFTFTNPVTVLEDNALPGHSNQTANNFSWVQLPDCVEIIGNRAFFQHHYLTDIGMSSNVKVIGERAFYDCSALTSIDLPSGLKAIGQEAFRFCDHLTTVKIPQSVIHFASICPDCTDMSTFTDWGIDPFLQCYGLVSFDPDGKYATDDGAFLLANAADVLGAGNTGKVLLSFALNHPDHKTSCTVPSNVTHIWDAALNNATFSSLSLPDGLKSIGYIGIADCINLTELVIPDTVESIGNYGLAGNTAMTKLTMKSKQAPTVGSCVFGLDSNNAPTTPCTVYVPASGRGYTEYNWSPNPAYGVQNSKVWYQADYEVWIWSTNCDSSDFGQSNFIDYSDFNVAKTAISNLLSTSEYTLEPAVPIPSGISPVKVSIVQFEGPVTRVGANAFSGWVSTNAGDLKYVSLPSTVTEIGASAFKNCNKLLAFPVPNGGAALTKVENNAFEECGQMSGTLTAPNLTTIGEKGFYRTSAMNVANVDSVTSIGWLGLTHTSGTSLYLPAIVTVGSAAFNYSPNLTSVTFGPNLTSVDSYLFQGCNTNNNLTITFQDVNPTGHLTISDNAFKYYVSSTVGYQLYPVDKIEFHVPAGSLSAYQEIFLLTTPDYVNNIVEY